MKYINWERKGNFKKCITLLLSVYNCSFCCG